MNAAEFLDQAKKTMDERGKTYDVEGGGKQERSMGKTIQVFNSITGSDLTESEGWMFMVLLKLVRQWASDGYHHDSALDSVAYTSLMAEALDAEAKEVEAKITAGLSARIAEVRQEDGSYAGMGDPIYNKLK